MPFLDKILYTMKCSVLLLCLSLLASSFVHAQRNTKDDSQQVFGVFDAELIDALMPTVPGVAAEPGSSLNEQSVKPYMMPVRKSKQGTDDMSYALASCLEFYVNLNKNYKVNLSPDYISLNLEDQRSPGFVDAFQFLRDAGTVSAAILPFGSRTITSAVYATPSFKIDNYLILVRETTRARQKIFELRKALLRGNPVLIELQAEASLKQASDGQTWRNQQRGKVRYPLIVVGFDEQREAFEVMSTWGSSWGRGGYLWMDYDVIGELAQRAYVMVPRVRSTK